MSKFNRKKIAVTLAFAALFGNKASAMNSNKSQVKSPQTLAAVGGTASNINSAKSEKSLPVLAKILISVGIIGVGYNEVAGIISGKGLFTGKISVSNACRKIFSGKLQDDEQMPPDDVSDEEGNGKGNENENENAEKEVDENTGIIEKLSDKFNVIKDEDGNLDNQKIDSLKKALVEILKLENNKEILDKYSNTKWDNGDGMKFGDLLKKFIDNLKKGSIVITGAGIFYKIRPDGPIDITQTIHLVFNSGGLILVYYGKTVFKFSGNQLEVFPRSDKN